MTGRYHHSPESYLQSAIPGRFYQKAYIGSLEKSVFMRKEPDSRSTVSQLYYLISIMMLRLQWYKGNITWALYLIKGIIFVYQISFTDSGRLTWANTLITTKSL